MKRSMLTALLTAAIAFAGAATADEHHDAAHSWTYTGKHGPAHWGEVDPEFTVCSTGHFQSPIDIRDATPADLPAITFDYHDAPLKMVNNGHTIMVSYPAGSSMTVGGKRYELVQFHFHHPSEEKVAGKQYGMVAHLVHKDSDGHLAVVAVLLDVGKKSSQLLDTLWTNAPTKAGTEKSVAVTVNAAELLPAQRGYYTFPGSLTTPPCSEGVTWFVLKEPVAVSNVQVGKFARLYPNNARPIQQVAGRSVQQTK